MKVAFMTSRYMKVALLAWDGPMVAFMNLEYMKVAFMNLGGPGDPVGGRGCSRPVTGRPCVAPLDDHR
jgi:hypothetical protein